MNLLTMAWRYLFSRSLVTILTVIGVALGAALICSVLTLRRESERAFVQEGAIFDLVVGGKGSPLQLVLCAVYHLDNPPANVSWERYTALKNDPRVEAVYPLGLGDNIENIRIVGTNAEFFDLRRRDEDTKEMKPMFSFAEGERFSKPFQVVAGAEAARRLNLKVGDFFHGTHGLITFIGSEAHEEFPYEVVGVLDSTGTAMDRVVYTPMESVWQVHKAEADLHKDLYNEEEEDESYEEDDGDSSFIFGASAQREQRKEASALLVQLKTPGQRLWMADEVNRKTDAMAAIPVNEIHRLYQRFLRPMQQTLLYVAYLVVVVSALSVLATLYQAAERRRRDLAVMRALGAHPYEIFLLVFLEGAMLTILGVVLGWFLGHGGLALVQLSLQDTLGIQIDPWSVDRQEFVSLSFVAVSGLLAGVVPAILAYRRLPHADLGAGG